MRTLAPLHRSGHRHRSGLREEADPATLLPPRAARGSALIVTLLVVTVLAIIVAAFLQSMSTERMTARSYANKFKADLLTDAAFADATKRLALTMETGPYATIFSEENNAPYLFYAKRKIDGVALITERHPLFSTTFQSEGYFSSSADPIINPGPLTIADVDSTGADTSRTTTRQSDASTNINGAFGPYPDSFVGLKRGADYAEIRVNWLYVRDDEGRVIGRYAFWIDDECSKIDLRTAGNRDTNGIHSRQFGENMNEIAVDVLTGAGLNEGQINNLVAYKGQNHGAGTPSMSRYQTNAADAEEIESDAAWSQVRPYITTYSRHDDRSPDGKRKLDLNQLVVTTTDPLEIQQQVEAIAEAIEENLPEFGNRYYSVAGGEPVDVSPQRKQLYVRKIAANIRDFIDTDPNATVILGDGTAVVQANGNFVPYELIEDEIPIFGKETGPFLSEYMRIARVITPHFSSGVGELTFRIAHYVELHNMSNQTITYGDLGVNPFILLANRTNWRQTGSDPSAAPGVLRPADVKMFLPSDFSIPPNGHVFLTTDGPPFSDSQSEIYGEGIRYIIAKQEEDAEVFSGTWIAVDTGGKSMPDSTSDYEDYTITTEPETDNRYTFQVSQGGAPYADNRERLLFGDDNGLIDYVLRIHTVAPINLARNERNPSYSTTFLADSNTTDRNTINNAGTEPRFSREDLRSNTEISTLSGNTGSVWKAGGTGYGDTYSGTNNQQTLGSENFNYHHQPTLTGVTMWRRGWKEYTGDPAGNHFVANRPLRSLGELGFIYDPSRHDINGYRSHGATLRFGQQDAPSNNRNNNSAAADYQNWLGGRGSNDVTDFKFARNAFLLTDVFSANNIVSGRINPNSVLRDQTGMAMKSVIHNFRYEAAVPEMASAALSNLPVDSNVIIDRIKDQISSGQGFAAVGELSLLPVFHSLTTLTGVNMAAVSDAGREELFRRSENLLTTNSLAFTVYAVGQSGMFRGNTFHVSASSVSETTINLVPTYPAVEPWKRPSPEAWEIVQKRSLRQ